MTRFVVHWSPSVQYVFLPLFHPSQTISAAAKNNHQHHKKRRIGRHFRPRVSAGLPHFLPGLGRRKRRGSLAVAVAPSRFNAADLRIIDSEKDDANNSSSNAQIVEIPVTCYQVIGARNQAEKDEIVKSVMNLQNAEIDEGYTSDAVVSRKNLLVDVRDKLMFEPEYAGNIREKVPPKSSLRIPWSWLPGALCLLQEVGEEKLVLQIGQKSLQHPDAKPHVHDLLLSMALAQCAIARVCFEKTNISQGFEALARARCLLRSKTSLENLKLLLEIEESLERLAPNCALELLGMPCTPENAEGRIRAISALRELLRQGLDVEASCQVQEWPCFLSQALDKLMATEIVNLLPWDSLAVTRKNKKSIESQNQRVVIDLNCFYVALTAHIALGFSSKQTDLISRARTICECLIVSEGIDLKFEEAFCLFVLGQVDEAEAVEKLQQRALDTDPASGNSISGKDVKGFPSTKPSLESWLKENVLILFPDTQDCSPSLANFFSGEKKASEIRQIRGSSHAIPLSPALASDRRALDMPPFTNSSRHLGLAVKQLAPSNLQGTLTVGKASSENDDAMPSVQLKRNLGTQHDKFWKGWLGSYNVVGKIAFVMALGCILFATIKLSAMQLWRVRSSDRWASGKGGIVDSSLGRRLGPACISGNSIAYRLKKLTSVFKIQIGRNHPDDANLRSSRITASLSSSAKAVCKSPMPMKDAESLVKQWQAVKAEALGPGHKVHSLFQVLDGPMLAQWQAVADEAKNRSCFWRFVLLQLSVIRAEILLDGAGAEMAEIEALLEEAAELVDETQLKNPSYYSAYRICYVLRRQDDNSWRFCEGEIQTP